MGNTIICGAGGLLGGAFCEVMNSNVIRVSRNGLSMDQPERINDLIVAVMPAVVINCAAHTDLEAAEHDEQINNFANAQLPAILGSACRCTNSLLVHFSSTGCYGNWKDEPYTENDDLRPTTAHHRAKAAGEENVRLSGCRHIIIRTGWLYGGQPGQPKNFVWRRMLEGLRTPTLRSDTYQRGCPTFAGDLVRQTFAIVQGGLTGTFNATSQGTASRYQYVKHIIEAAHVPCDVEPGPPFKRLAPVSHNEMAINARLQSTGLDIMPKWRLSLTNYVGELLMSEEWKYQQMCRLER